MEALMNPYHTQKEYSGYMPGVWLSCNICYKKRLDCSLATLTYHIPSIRNISRTIRYCRDDEECTYQALARQYPRRV